MSSMSRERTLPEPERAKTKPKKITTPGKPGDSGPGGAHPGRNRPKREGKEFNPKEMSPEQRKRVDDEVKRRGWKGAKTKSAGEKGMGSGKGE